MFARREATWDKQGSEASAASKSANKSMARLLDFASQLLAICHACIYAYAHMIYIIYRCTTSTTTTTTTTTPTYATNYVASVCMIYIQQFLLKYVYFRVIMIGILCCTIVRVYVVQLYVCGKQ